MYSHDRCRQVCEELLEPTGITINGSKEYDIKVHNPNVFKKILSKGSLGFGESYMDGEWDCDSLDELFARILSNDVRTKLKKLKPSHLLTAILSRGMSVVTNPQSVSKSRQVGEQHYDLGSVYKSMLDKRMVYSCGYWKSDEFDLNKAQESKLELTCEKVRLKPGMKVLDIGCGWGSFLKYAAEKYGIEGVGVSISKNQVEFGNQSCHGLPIKIKLQDYRYLNGEEEFDAIVSLGMFEHVGPKNYKTFMKVVDRNLKHGGLFLLHTIGSNNTKSLGMDPWINKYIFPGGKLPSQAQIASSAEGIFVNEDWHSLTDESGSYYDKTLMAWHNNFKNSWSELQEQYGERFKRMWDYYLLSCAGSFRSRNTQTWQAVFSRKGEVSGYKSIR
jgi:cyclopropane-fatty-acyl-phospholipid synthase